MMTITRYTRPDKARRRAVSIRYCGDDARYRFRKGVPRKAHHEQVAEGDIMDHPDCPVVWPR